jgi:hypothetical protein
MPRQGTETSPTELQDMFKRVVCHVLVDQIPSEAFEELLRSMLELKEFYATSPSVPPSQTFARLPSGRPMNRANRSVRPEVVIEE